MEPSKSRAAVDIPAEDVTAEAQKVTLAVMQESLHLFSEEFRAKVQEAKDARQQLALRIEAQESVCKEVTCLSEEVKKHSEALKAQQCLVIVEHLQAVQAQQKGILSTVDMWKSCCDEEFAKIRSELFAVRQFARNDLARIKEQMDIFDPTKNNTSKNASPNKVRDAPGSFLRSWGLLGPRCPQDPPKPSCETREHIDKQICNLDDHVSQIKFQIRTMSTNWEVTRKAALSELKNQSEETKEHVDKKISQVSSELQQHRALIREYVDERVSGLHLIVSQIKGEQEAKHLPKIEENCMTDQLEEMRSHVEEVQRQLSEYSMQPRHEEELKALMERTNEQVSNMKNEMQGMRRQLPESNTNSDFITCSDPQKHVDAKNIEFQSHLSEIKSEQEAKHLSNIDELEEMRAHVLEVQRQLSEYSMQSRHEEGLKVLMERANKPVFHMKNETHDMRKQLTESNVNSDFFTCSDLRKYVDEKNNELQSRLSEIKVEQGSKHLSKTKRRQLLEMRAHIEEAQAQLSDHSFQMSHERRCRMMAMFEHTNEQIVQMKDEMQGRQRLSSKSTACSDSVNCTDVEPLREATKEHAEVKNTEMHSHPPQIKDEQEAKPQSKANEEYTPAKFLPLPILPSNASMGTEIVTVSTASMMLGNTLPTCLATHCAGITSPGNTSPSNTSAGHTSPGNTSPGNTSAGNTSPGSTSPGNTLACNTSPGTYARQCISTHHSGNPSPGNVLPGNILAGSTSPSNTSPGGTSAGNTSHGISLSTCARQCIATHDLGIGAAGQSSTVMMLQPDIQSDPAQVGTPATQPDTPQQATLPKKQGSPGLPSLQSAIKQRLS